MSESQGCTVGVAIVLIALIAWSCGYCGGGTAMRHALLEDGWRPPTEIRTGEKQ